MSASNQEIDKQAADWDARRDLRNLNPEEQREFDSWLAADIRHLGAYGRAEAVLARLERLHGAAAIESAPWPPVQPAGQGVAFFLLLVQPPVLKVWAP